MTLEEIAAEIEADLYAALEALEQRDFITVRQCSARAQADAIDAFKKKQADEAVHPMDRES